MVNTRIKKETFNYTEERKQFACMIAYELGALESVDSLRAMALCVKYAQEHEFALENDTTDGTIDTEQARYAALEYARKIAAELEPVELDKDVTLNSDSVKKWFPDWNAMKPGFWSKHAKILRYAKNRKLEIGLYREPASTGPTYEGTYSLHVFDGDEIILCETVDDAVDYPYPH